MAADDLERFHNLVVHDEGVRAQLRAERNVQDFVAAVVVAAQKRGFDVSPDEVEASLLAARRRWRERW